MSSLHIQDTRVYDFTIAYYRVPLLGCRIRCVSISTGFIETITTKHIRTKK